MREGRRIRCGHQCPIARVAGPAFQSVTALQVAGPALGLSYRDALNLVLAADYDFLDNPCHDADLRQRLLAATVERS